jgi:hypothetical protein
MERLLLLVLSGSAALAAVSAAPRSSCDATKLVGDWTGSWWREAGKHPPATAVYTFTAQNATHFAVTSKSKHTGWEKGGAFGVLDADFSTTGRLSIHFPTNRKSQQLIKATIVDQVACAAKATEIWLDNKSVWCQGQKPGSKECGTGKHPPDPPGPPPPPNTANIERVFIVFSNHLDVGYTDNNDGSCAGAVVNRYWHDHFPKAMDTAEQFRQKQPHWRYKWMCHSWITSIYRHCATSPINIAGPGHPSDLVCPSAANISAFEAGVKAGDITWHVRAMASEHSSLAPTHSSNNARCLVRMRRPFHSTRSRRPTSPASLRHRST